jgi:ankyrin repeat protein
VRSLLAQEADVNAPQADGTTALAWAAHWDDLEMAEALLRAGAQVNAASDYGITALSLACTNGSAAMMEKLLAAGADPTHSLPTGETPLMTTARTGNLDAVKLLLGRGVDVNAQETLGQTALMWAVARKHAEVAKALVEHGADIHARSKGGFTPLLFAARAGDVNSARVLLDAGADANETTLDGMSVLLLAAASGHENLAVFLVEKGADPNATDAYGITALHYAVQKGLSILGAVQDVPVAQYMFRPNMPKLVNALLGHGANPNARVEKAKKLTLSVSSRASMAGATPFLLAAATGDVSLMRVLAAAGASPVLATAQNVTPLMVAAGIGRLQDRRGEEEERNALEAVQAALEMGNDVNAVNDNGRTALYGAATSGGNAIARFLVEQGAKVNVKDKFGMAPWNLASGVLSPNVLNSDKLNPIHQSTADLLVELGAVPMTQEEANALGAISPGRPTADYPETETPPPSHQRSTQ